MNNMREAFEQEAAKKRRFDFQRDVNFNDLYRSEITHFAWVGFQIAWQSQQAQNNGAVQVYPTKDRECGHTEAGWCESCPKRAQGQPLPNMREAFVPEHIMDLLESIAANTSENPREDAHEIIQCLQSQQAQSGDGCLLCANGNDLPEGEYCRACGKENNLSSLGKAVKKARGSEMPPESTVTSQQAQGEGEQCQNCLKHYSTIYRIPNDVWAKIAPQKEALGDYSEHQLGGLLCVDCAWDAAKQEGITLYFDGSPKCWHECKSAPSEVPEEMDVRKARDYDAKSSIWELTAFTEGWNKCRDGILTQKSKKIESEINKAVRIIENFQFSHPEEPESEIKRRIKKSRNALAFISASNIQTVALKDCLICGGCGVDPEPYEVSYPVCCNKPHANGECCGDPIQDWDQEPQPCRQCDGSGKIYILVN